MFRNLYQPETFQGSLTRRSYFEGWYYKQVTRGRDAVWIFIPGISIHDHDVHAFIQIADGIRGRTHYLRYPIESFHWTHQPFSISIGDSVFSEDRINLNCQSPEITVKGSLQFYNRIRYPRSLLSPNIMGWYSFVPFMQCKHAIISVRHDLQGTLMIKDHPVDFTHGTGYAEKDWGRSFPESWIWGQCHTFENSDASLFFSIARIPWPVRDFTGWIAFLYVANHFYRFHSYAHSRILHWAQDNEKTVLSFGNRTHRLELAIFSDRSFSLIAPDDGRMQRLIQESSQAVIQVTLKDGQGTELFRDKGLCAGFETAGKVFSP